MSSTNRGAKRNESDFYATPAWCVQNLLKAVNLPGGQWLEPAAGDGAIIRAVNRPDVKWDAWEIRSEEKTFLAPLADVHIGDFTQALLPTSYRYAVAITNPPFSLAQEFIEKAMYCADHVVMLLRLNYLASKKRYDFMSKNTPDVYVLPTRPSFTNGGTDSIEYAWFVWKSGQRNEGIIKILDPRGT